MLLEVWILIESMAPIYMFYEMQLTYFNRIIPAVVTRCPGSHLLQACTTDAG